VLVLITDTGQELALVGYSGAQVGGMLAARDIEVHTINPIGQNSVFDPITSATGGQTWSIGDASGSGISTALDSIATDLADELGTTTTFEVQVSHGSGDENRIDLQMPMDATANGLGLSSVTVTTVEEARAAMDALDDAIDTLSGIQTHVGVSHNRLMFALENETTALENTEAARSRILDADMAAETAALAREQILAQASVGMAAQAWKLEKEVLERILESQ
jgi:flagellin